MTFHSKHQTKICNLHPKARRRASPSHLYWSFSGLNDLNCGLQWRRQLPAVCFFSPSFQIKRIGGRVVAELSSCSTKKSDEWWRLDWAVKIRLSKKSGFLDYDTQLFLISWLRWFRGVARIFPEVRPTFSTSYSSPFPTPPPPTQISIFLRCLWGGVNGCNPKHFCCLWNDASSKIP